MVTSDSSDGPKAPEQRKRTTLGGDLRAHPAIRAWAMATSLEAAPDCIHVHRERPRSAIYWLPGVAPGGASVFAKRAVAPRTVIERTLYRDVLPHLPLTSPRYYGSWLDEVHGWLFVEDVGGERYSESDPEHLTLAGRWVATLHVEGGRLPPARSLPDGGPARYLTHLRTAREKIQRSLGSWRYPRNEIEQLTAILSHLDAIEARWSRVEAAVDGAPSTVVHGDFRPKNGYLRRNGSGLCIFPIDWETAGWGPPAADLTRIDLGAYWSVVRDGWPHVDFEAVLGWRRIGRLLEQLAAANWMAETLKCEGAAARSWAVEDLKVVLDRMTRAARAAQVVE
jgi:aminoglycoside phosphotransferase (APT) family kinase protein